MTKTRTGGYIHTMHVGITAPTSNNVLYTDNIILYTYT